MGVGFCLAGRFEGKKGESAVRWLERVQVWLENDENEPLLAGAVNQEGDQPFLILQVHPCAEDVEFSLPEPGRIVVSAKTSTVGPGYHLYLCQLLRKLGKEFHIEWEPPDLERGQGDDTGFFYTGDVSAVQDEMLRWLQSVARLVLQNQAGQTDGLMISMPLDHQFQVPREVSTPVGPRSAAWFARMIQDPIEGKDFFTWWEEGVGADFFRGRAMARIWQECPWRAPLIDEEAELMQAIHHDLERAYQKNPQLDLPWREWQAILGYLEERFGYIDFLENPALAEIIPANAQQLSGPLMGYRRFPMRVRLTGGWSLEVPGYFAERWENEGENWIAWHDNRTVLFTSLSFKKEDETIPDAREILQELPLPTGEAFPLQVPSLLGEAYLGILKDGGKEQWHLQGRAAVAGGAALVSILFPNPADREWTLQTWQSLRWTPPEDPCG